MFPILINDVKKGESYAKQIKKSIHLFSLAVSIFLLFVSCSKSTEIGWPRWRRPTGDGIYYETDWNPAALADGPKILCKADVGEGHSNVAIKDNRLYTTGMMGIVCLNAETGEEIWLHEIRTIGPMATPAIDGKYLYALTERGILMCLAAKNGKLRWQKDLPSEYDVEKLPYGFNTSPVIDGDLIILNLNTSGIALDKKTGELVWASDRHKKLPSPDGHYATAVLFDYNGVRSSLLFSSGGLYCVETKTGRRLGHHEFRSQYNSPDPILVGNRVFVAGAGGGGPQCALLDISTSTPKVVWTNNHLSSAFPTSVHVDGYLYGSKGTRGTYAQEGRSHPFRCVDLATGQVMWEREMVVASVAVADGKLIILEANGTLHIAEATPTAYKEISSCELPVQKMQYWWTPPVLYMGKIYCRNLPGDLVCIDVGKDS